MKYAKQKSNTKFLKIACPRCSQYHIIYGKSTSKIKCVKCNLLLTKTSGGKTQIRAPIKKVLQ